MADTVCGIRTELPGIAGTAVFKLFDLQVARTGLTLDEALKAGFEAEQEIVKTRSKAHGHPGSTDIWVQMLGNKRSLVNRLDKKIMVCHLVDNIQSTMSACLWSHGGSDGYGDRNIKP